MKTVTYKHYTIVKLDSGRIEATNYGKLVPITKPLLRELAQELGVSIYNSKGTIHNTRQLGILVMQAIEK